MSVSVKKSPGLPLIQEKRYDNPRRFRSEYPVPEVYLPEVFSPEGVELLVRPSAFRSDEYVVYSRLASDRR